MSFLNEFRMIFKNSVKMRVYCPSVTGSIPVISLFSKTPKNRGFSFKINALRAFDFFKMLQDFNAVLNVLTHFF